jgi:hypothetical protein
MIFINIPDTGCSFKSNPYVCVHILYGCDVIPGVLKETCNSISAAQITLGVYIG